MATEAQLDVLFRRAALAATEATGAEQSQTNLPDTRNLPSSETASVLNPLEMARRSDLESVRRPGVPLDFETGAPAGTRFQLAFTSDTPNQIKLLQAKYGVENIAVSPQGQLVIRNLMDNETGKIRDIVVDETQMSAKDFIDLAQTIPEIAGAAAGIWGANKTPGLRNLGSKLSLLRDAVAGAAGSQAAAELTQTVLGEETRSLAEILKQRATSGAAETALNIVTAGTAKAIPALKAKLSGPLSGRQTIVQTEAVPAAARLNKAAGTDFQFTIGEETGAPTILQSEALLEKVKGGASIIKAAKDVQQNELQKIQRHIGKSVNPTRTGTLPSESSLGASAIDRLRQIASPVEEAVPAAKLKVADTASAEILASFDEMVTPGRQLYKTPVGESIKLKAVAERENFQATSKALYDDVYATPGAKEPIIPMTKVGAAAKEIKLNLPKKTKVIEEISEILDETGKPITTTTEGKEILREFVPPKLKRFLNELESGLDPKMPLNEVVQMRSILNDAIDQGDVLPGVGTRYLKQISHALTEAIDDGVKALPDQTLAKKLANANAYYKTERPRFEKRAIQELLVPEGEPGSIGRAAVVKRIASGEVDVDHYMDIKQFLGANSTQFKNLKRSILDDIYEDSRITGQGDIIDAKTFVNKLTKLDREVLQDIFGKKGATPVQIATLLGEVQGKIDVRALDPLLANGTLTGNAVRDLIRQQQQLDTLYANNVVRKFVKGEVGAEAIKPDEFVARYLDVAKTPGEVEEVMQMLGASDPQLVADIRQKTIEKFFAKAARNPTPTDIARNISGDPTQTVSGATMYKAFGNESEKAKLATVLGTDTMQMLEDYVRVTNALDHKEDVAKTVGGLVGGGIMARLTSLDFKDALSIAKYKLVAMTLANPKLRPYLTRQAAAPDTRKLAQVIIASNPLFENASKEFGEESGLAGFYHTFSEALSNAFGNGDGEAVTPPEAGKAERFEQLFKQVAPAQ